MVHFIVLPALSSGPAEGDVLRVCGEGLDAREELFCCGGVVEAESDAAEVVRRDVHHVEQLILRRVLGQVVDHVLPQREARPLLHQEDLQLQFQLTSVYSVQGGPSGCTLHFVDIKLRVAF